MLNIGYTDQGWTQSQIGTLMVAIKLRQVKAKREGTTALYGCLRWDEKIYYYAC